MRVDRHHIPKSQNIESNHKPTPFGLNAFSLVETFQHLTTLKRYKYL
jgi:hypothetical protein